MSKTIIGIDPGIADTGYGVIKVSGGNLECIDYGSIQTKAGTVLSKRLLKLSIALDKLIKKHKPDLVSVEELFFCNNAKTALIVGQARGVVLLTIEQNKTPMVEFTPLQIKQAVSSFGQADKGQVQRMVKLILNLKELPRPDDAADALAAAICASNTKL